MKRVYESSAGLSQERKEKVDKELFLGFLNLSDGFFAQAEMNFKLALEFDKTCPDAFWGLCLANFRIKNEEELYSNPVQYKNVLKTEECHKALECANETLKKKYENLLERIYKINEGENY